MSQIIETPVIQDLPDVVEDERLTPGVAHAYCRTQVRQKPLEWKAVCGYIRKGTPTRMGEGDMRCAVCEDLIANHAPCPHCGIRMGLAI